MKKVKLLFIFLISLGSFILTSCTKSQYVFTDVSGIIYAKGTQTVTITVSEDSTTFEKNLKPEYITLSDNLKGKTVESFTYVSDTKAEVCLSGTLETIDTSVSYDYYNIELSNDALKGNSTATVILTVYSSSPSITAVSIFYSKGKIASSSFVLPYGNFMETNCNIQNITLPDTNGEISVISVQDNKLKITVINFTPSDSTQYPIVKLSKNCTSFDIDLYLYIGVSSFSADLC